MPLPDRLNPWRRGRLTRGERYALGRTAAWALWDYLDLPTGANFARDAASRATLLDHAANTLDRLWRVDIAQRPDEPFDFPMNLPEDPRTWLGLVDKVVGLGRLDACTYTAAVNWQRDHPAAFNGSPRNVTAHRDFLPHNLLIDGDAVIALDLERVGAGSAHDEIIALHAFGWTGTDVADRVAGNWWARGLRRRLPALAASPDRYTLAATVRLLHLAEVQRSETANPVLTRALLRLLTTS